MLLSVVNVKKIKNEKKIPTVSHPPKKKSTTLILPTILHLKKKGLNNLQSNLILHTDLSEELVTIHRIHNQRRKIIDTIIELFTIGVHMHILMEIKRGLG